MNYEFQELGRDLSTKEIFLRLGTAALLGGLIGLNRDLKNKPAGLRTHAMVALGAALVVLLTFKQVGNSPIDGNGLSRVIQGILTGIGFLGVGVILRSEDGKHVHGLTTAATIWLVATLGAGCGVGYWIPILAASMLAFFILLLGGSIEKTLHRWLRPKTPPVAAQSAQGSPQKEDLA